ncbi:MAG: hypothetical protein K2F92_00550, partial [Alistipes sp.]|nr:hypothetical protein [Alistipes sp.]
MKISDERISAGISNETSAESSDDSPVGLYVGAFACSTAESMVANGDDAKGDRNGDAAKGE